MHFNIQAMLHHDGYFGVFVILLLEMIGIPFPAETTLTISGFEWSKGVFRLFPLILAAGLGNIVGSTIAFYIGRLLGRTVIVRFGKYVGITHERLDKSHEMLRKYRGWVVIIGKFIAGIRVIVPYIAGINDMNFFVFSIYNAISAFLWATAFIVLGRYIGIEWARYHKVLHQYMVPAIIIAALLIGLYVTYKVVRKRKESRDKQD